MTTVSHFSNTRNDVPAGHVGLLFDDGEAVVGDVGLTTWFGWPSCPGSVTSAAYWAATIPNFAKTWRYIA